MKTKIQAVPAVDTAPTGQHQFAAKIVGSRRSATATRRRRRGTAAVVAQYIQDLTRPAEPAPCM